MVTPLPRSSGEGTISREGRWISLFLLVCLASAGLRSAAAADFSVLRINEVLASNKATRPADFNGKYQDMVEIYNSGTQPLPLPDLILSNGVTKDSLGNYHPVSPWTFSDGSILPKGFVTIFCDGNDGAGGQGEPHASFKLSNDGGLVALFTSDEVLIDMVIYPRLPQDVSYGRLPDGSGPFCYMPVPSFKNCTVLAGGCITSQNKPCGNISPEMDFKPQRSIAAASDASPATGAPVHIVGQAWDDKPAGVIRAVVVYQVNGGAQVEVVLALDQAQTAALTRADPLNPNGAPLPDPQSSVWTGQIPGQPAGSVVTFVLRAEDADGASGTDPAVFCEGSVTQNCTPPYSYHVGYSYQGPLVLNEVLPFNSLTVQNPTSKKFDDYIELYSSQDLTLEGLTLGSNPFRASSGWLFPLGSKILKGQHLLVWCDSSSKDTRPAFSDYHTNFKLDSTGGDAVFIFDTAANGQTILDGYKFGPTAADKAYSRVPDGDRTGQFVVMAGSPAAPNPSLGPTFIRGDCDSSGVINLTDAVVSLNFLFLAGPALPCADAADVDDSGVLDLTDPIALLSYLFLSGPAPMPPFPGPGTDPTLDSLGCSG